MRRESRLERRSDEAEESALTRVTAPPARDEDHKAPVDARDVLSSGAPAA